MKANIGARLAEAREALGFEQPEQRRRRLTDQAAELLRMGAPGRALEVLEEILRDYEKQAAEERSAEQLFAAVLPLLPASPLQPFKAVVRIDSVEVECPCGAIIVGEGECIMQFKAEHLSHTNGATVEFFS